MKRSRLFMLLLVAELMLCASGPDLSAAGPLSVQTITFPDLRDPARAGRAVPIKARLPWVKVLIK